MLHIFIDKISDDKIMQLHIRQEQILFHNKQVIIYVTRFN